MEIPINFLVADSQKNLPEMIALFSIFPAQTTLIDSNLTPISAINKDSLGFIIFSCNTAKDFESLLSAYVRESLLAVSIIVVVNTVEEGEELLDFGANNYLVKNLISREAILQVVNATIRIKSLKESLENTKLSNKKYIEKLTKEFDQFTYIISHDLRAPLRAISSLSEWIEEDLAGSVNVETRKNLVLLRERAKFSSVLIDGVLKYSRVSRTNSSIEFVNVTDLLNDLIYLKIDKPVGYSIEIEPNMPKFYTQSERLEQVFWQLLKNAIQFHDRCDGVIKILVREQENFYRFTVSDNGPGIASELHQKIFEIFYTVQKNVRTDSVGIGLALVKKIVELVGGSVWVESNSDGGSAFHFLWPKCLQNN